MHKKLVNYSQIFHVKHALSEVLKPEMFHAGKNMAIFRLIFLIFVSKINNKKQKNEPFLPLNRAKTP